MKEKFIFISVIFISIIFSINCFSEVLYVSNAMDSSILGARSSNYYSSLKDALLNAKSGDTIEVGDSINIFGTTMVINKSISLVSQENVVSYIKVLPSAKPSNFPLFQITNGATLTMSGFNIVPPDISTNSLNNRGSAFDIENGSLNLSQCTICDTPSSVGGARAINGGAIYVSSTSSCNITNSTIFGTSASSLGGAIYNDGTLTLNADTISGCSADSAGYSGGIFNAGTLTLSNSIIAGNTTDGSYGDYDSLSNSSLVDSGFNVIGKSADNVAWNISDWISNGGTTIPFFQVGSLTSGSLNLATVLGFNGGTVLTLPVTSAPTDTSVAVSIPQTVYTSLLDPNAQNLGAFGTSLSINQDDTIMAIGVPKSGTKGSTDGIVYTYVGSNGNWSSGVSFELSNPSESDFFGQAVDLDGNNLVIGAPGVNNSSGAAWIYSNSNGTWTSSQLTNGNPDVNNLHLGTSVTISGNNIAVGGYGSNSSMIQGRVDFYNYNGINWKFVNSVTDGDFNSDFGAAVAIDGNIAVVGEPGANNNKGLVKVYSCDGKSWTPIGTIASPSSQNQTFGYSVAMDSDGNGGYNIIIGAPSYSLITSRIKDSGNSGYAYIYDMVNGVIPQSPTAILVSPSSQGNDNFGYSVAICGNTLLVGSPFLSNTDLAGNVYMFTYSSGVWGDAKLISSPSSQNGDGYGNAVSLNSKTMVVGSFDKSFPSYSFAGEAYVSNLENVYYNGDPSVDERGFSRADSSINMRTIGSYEVNATATKYPQTP